MRHFKKYLGWFDDYGLLVLASFLLAFIPLYPKLPLFEAIPGYIVRVRLEDLVVLLTVMLWGIQLLRKKVAWRTPLTYMIVAYAVVGLLSILSAVFITKTVPMEMLHIGKTALHYFRYLEYFSLFFILYSAIRTTKHAVISLVVILATVTAISIYGIGQKYFYWPVYSTMNREFSKGIRLYLTEHARVQSTFGGHYDLGAYLVMTLPIVLSAFYLLKRKLYKVLVGGVFLLGLWLLTVTASRTSFIAFGAAAWVVILLIGFYLKTSWQARLKWIISRSLGLLAVTMLMLSFFGDDMTERLLQVIDSHPTLHKIYHDSNAKRKDLITYVEDKFFSEEQQEQISKIKPKKPTNALSVEEAEVLVASDQRPVQARPSDVYVDVPDLEVVATQSADGTITQTTIEKDRTYSLNALTFGLSFAIRLDTLWPRALQGFYTNPLLGTGYATLTKESITQFTEAESTDNNFLRTLGETGLLGFVTFYGVLIISMMGAWHIYHRKPDNPVIVIFAISFLAGSVGLLLNAVFIDVFAASKVAFTLWALAGIVLAIDANLKSSSTENKPSSSSLPRNQNSPKPKKQHSTKSAEKSKQSKNKRSKKSQ